MRKKIIPESHYNRIYDLIVNQKLPQYKVAEMYGVNPSSIWRALHKSSAFYNVVNLGNMIPTVRSVYEDVTEDELLNPGYSKLKYNDVKGEIPKPRAEVRGWWEDLEIKAEDEKAAEIRASESNLRAIVYDRQLFNNYVNNLPNRVLK